MTVRFDDAAFVCEDHGLDSVAKAEFHEDALDVAPYRRLLDDESGRDLAIRHPAGNEFENFPFAWSQPVELGLTGKIRSRLLRHAVDHPSSN